MSEFLNLSLARAGADQMITPREMLRDYMTVLNILMQNEQVTFEDVIRTALCECEGAPAAKEGEPREVATQAFRVTYTAEDIEF